MKMGLTRAVPIVAIMALAAAISIAGTDARAQQSGAVSISLKNHRFEPANVHAPAHTPLTITVKNLDKTVMEFESGALRVEKVIPAGGTGIVHVRALSPGRYEFYDDFHHATRGHLLVP